MILPLKIWTRHNIRGWLGYLFLPPAIFLSIVGIPCFLFSLENMLNGGLVVSLCCFAIGVIPMSTAIPMILFQRKIAVADIHRKDNLQAISGILSTLAYFGGFAMLIFIMGHL